MANLTTSAVYIHVIEDVINKVRDEFTGNGGPGEGVLTELQGLWEMRLIQAGAILSPIERPSAAKGVLGGPTPVHDLNVPYEGTEEYETPTAEMLFPPVSSCTVFVSSSPEMLDSGGQVSELMRESRIMRVRFPIADTIADSNPNSTTCGRLQYWHWAE
ncbi:hypothetical protein Dimus_009173 [Dionaea muscipula]